MVNASKFTTFLVEAKKNKNTDNFVHEDSSRPMSKDSTFRKYGFYYLDSSLGNKNFIGEEVVWANENVYWGMNYKGGLTVKDTPLGFKPFLKEVLLNVSEESPFRGPKKYEKSDFTYSCTWDGTIDDFSGFETIEHKGIEVYKLHFQGGKLK